MSENNANTTLELADITPYGYVKDEKVYLKGYMGFEDREIGVVRESPEQSLQYFVDRFETIKKKIEEVGQAVEEADNKGSYLMKLIHMRTHLASYNGLGDFPGLFEEINGLEERINDYIAKNREKNYAIKKALLEEAEIAKLSDDWREATRVFKELKLKWIKTGSAHKEYEDELNTRFNGAIDFFFERRKVYMEEQAKISAEKVNRYTALIEELKQINGDGSDPSYLNRVKQIQANWKAVGRVHRSKFGKLNNEFRRQVEIFYNRLKRRRQAARKPPLEVKKDMCAAVDKMLEIGEPYNIPAVKKMQHTWKNIGKLPEPEDRDLNLRFRIICNEIFESYFLDLEAKKSTEDYYALSAPEKIRLKIGILKDSIKLDGEELNAISQEYNHGGAYSYGQESSQMNPQTYQKRNNIVNKLKTKERMLRKLQEKLFDV